ncbi:hypothetical protein MHYP_G00019150 [Metynnis hypsauchen]
MWQRLSAGVAGVRGRRLYSAVPGRVFVATRSHSAQGEREISPQQGRQVLSVGEGGFWEGNSERSHWLVPFGMCRGGSAPEPRNQDQVPIHTFPRSKDMVNLNIGKIRLVNSQTTVGMGVGMGMETRKFPVYI